MFLLRIYLPLALGYAVSYFFRNANAIIESDLVVEFGIGPASLGLLTSVYFFSFATFQLPLGFLLDRYGPRRTESFLLLFATLGAFIFSQAESLSGLIVGRLLIGLGVSACLMGAFKAYVIWFPTERLAIINGMQMVAGGVGALLATIPLQKILLFFDWRNVFIGLAIISFFVSLSIWLFLPEHKRIDEKQSLKKLEFKEMWQVLRSLTFWGIAPLAAISQGTNLAIHGLWIKPWLRDVVGITEVASGKYLFAMTLALIAGFLILGIIAERLSYYFSTNPIKMSVFGMTIFLILQGVMAYGYAGSPLLLIMLLGFFGTSSILVYAGYANLFPKNLSGRVSSFLNFMVFLGAFILQWGVGVIIQMWPTVGKGYDPESYRVAIGFLILIQVISLIWYFCSLKLSEIRREMIKLN